jgi:hypothetical protein
MGRRLAARVLLAGALVAAPAGAATGQAPERLPERPGSEPVTPWACPASHPIKGYLTDESGRVYHRPGTRYYEETSPERCYASEEEARGDGSRRAPDG